MRQAIAQIIVAKENIPFVIEGDGEAFIDHGVYKVRYYKGKDGFTLAQVYPYTKSLWAGIVYRFHGAGMRTAPFDELNDAIRATEYLAGTKLVEITKEEYMK